MNEDSKFGPWRSEAKHATSRSWRLPAIFVLNILKYFLYKPEPEVFKILNHHKCLGYLVPLHLNTSYVMGLRQLCKCLTQCRERLETSESDVYRRQSLASKVDPCTARDSSTTQLAIL